MQFSLLFSSQINFKLVFLYILFYIKIISIINQIFFSNNNFPILLVFMGIFEMETKLLLKDSNDFEKVIDLNQNVLQK